MNVKRIQHLARKGILITIMSPHWTFANEKKCVAFREWLDSIGAEVEALDAGLFKESGTNVKTMLVSIVKP